MHKLNVLKGLAITILIAALAVAAEIPGQSAAASSGSGGSSYFPLSQIKEGLRGTAKTVFRGNTAEDFGVEILGVLPGAIGPQQDLIIGRLLSGSPAERTAVFAGMSGSPVYIEGRLVGAISYSFPFSKEPICGITPIEQMVSIFEKNQPVKAVSSEPRPLSFAELASAVWTPDKFTPQSMSSTVSDSKLASITGGSLQPIATPLTFSGISQSVLDRFAPQLMSVGLLPVASAGGASKISPMKKAEPTTLVGGSSVSMELARGDYSIAASGTVTLRDGNKIYAFGHPFLSLGTSDLPMSESHVVTVVPNLNNSFKLAVPDSMVGAMKQDRSTGVYGELSQAPVMIPVKLNLETSRGQQKTFNFEVVNDDFLTPLLLNISIYNSLLSNERGLGDSTIELTGEIAVKGNEPVKLERRLVGGQSAQLAAGAVALPVNALIRSRFDDLSISGISLNIRSFDGSKAAALERLVVDRTQIRAGDTIDVQAYARTAGGRVFVERIPVTIPADTPPGLVSIMIGDGGAIQQNAAIQQFVPKSLTEMISTMNRIKMPDRLYLQAARTTSGALIGVNEMPNLPPSVLATMNSDRVVGAYKPYLQTVIIERELPPAEFVVTGQQKLDIQVIK
jgi:hypothetical protein